MSGTKLVYIGGYGRSGSTLISLFFSNNTDSLAVGEASNLFDYACENSKCSCGENLAKCSFWSPYLKEVDVYKLRAQQRASEGVFGVFGYFFSRSYRNFWRKVLLDAERSCKIVIDSSKLSRMTLFRPINMWRLGARVSIVHIHKEPHQLLASLIKGSNKNIEFHGGSQRVDHVFLLRSYFGALFANMSTFLIGKLLPFRYISLDYDGFLSDPQQILRKLDINCFPGSHSRQLFPHHELGGNRMIRSDSPIFIDPSKRLESASAAKVPYIYGLLFRTLGIFYGKS